MHEITRSSREEWEGRFCARLHELRPRIGDKQRLDLASGAFKVADDIEPEEAAVVFAEILDAGVPLADMKRWL